MTKFGKGENKRDYSLFIKGLGNGVLVLTLCAKLTRLTPKLVNDFCTKRLQNPLFFRYDTV